MERETKIANNYNEIPVDIKDSLNEANVFFSYTYENYAKLINTKMIYVYDDKWIIPINIIKKKFFVSGVILSEEYSYNDLLNEDDDCFLNRVIQVLKMKTKISWIITGTTALFHQYPNHSERIPFGSHIINLDLNEDELWKNVHARHRNYINKAKKQGMKLKIGGKELINDYVRLDMETWKRSGKKSNGYDYFDLLISGLKENVVLCVTYLEEVPQAGACYYYNKEMAYYIHGASSDHISNGGAKFLHWEMIRYFKKLNVKKYSFVGCRINEDKGSKYEGIQRFKRGFGGELEQGYMWRYIFHSYKWNLYRNLYKIKKHRYPSSPIDEEIHKWTKLNSD